MQLVSGDFSEVFVVFGLPVSTARHFVTHFADDGHVFDVRIMTRENRFLYLRQGGACTHEESHWFYVGGPLHCIWYTEEGTRRGVHPLSPVSLYQTQESTSVPVMIFVL